jgi:hypothetical protein
VNLQNYTLLSRKQLALSSQSFVAKRAAPKANFLLLFGAMMFGVLPPTVWMNGNTLSFGSLRNSQPVGQACCAPKTALGSYSHCQAPAAG